MQKTWRIELSGSTRYVAVLVATIGLLATSLGLSAVGAGAQPMMCLGQSVTVDLGAGDLPTDGDDVIAGTDGDDAIAAGDGDDLICGGAGNDSIWGQNGNDQIDGGDGDDKIRGGDGDDILHGGPGADDISGGRDNDTVSGGDGDDTKLRGGTGDDVMHGDAGDDVAIHGNGGQDMVYGDDGDDALITGGPRPDMLWGGPGNDVLRGHKGADSIWGGTGDDVLSGGPQPDALDGGDDTDSCFGGTEIDTAVNCETESNIAELRVATFNASLNRGDAGELMAELAEPGSEQPATIAEIIQRAAPDVVLINEFDYDAEGLGAQLFQQNYLGVSQNGAPAIEYPYVYSAPSNTGVPSGFDLDNSGEAGDFAPSDSFGFGFFEGQFAMVVYSKYPIDDAAARTFQNFLWKDMPGALLPDDPETDAPADWYSPEELDVFRLSSKSHWDVPILVGGHTVHLLASHPTPPVFDGDEDRNGTRNHDEIRFWADYIAGADYIYDDAGVTGGLGADAQFVIAGDLNADPFDGDSTNNPAALLTENVLVNNTVVPSAPGGTEAVAQGAPNEAHLGDPSHDTADFGEAEFGGPGNLRVDYVLPSANLEISQAGVFWPGSDDPLSALSGTFPFPSSDHRLVWVDLALESAEAPA